MKSTLIAAALLAFAASLTACKSAPPEEPEVTRESHRTEDTSTVTSTEIIVE